MITHNFLYISINSNHMTTSLLVLYGKYELILHLIDLVIYLRKTVHLLRLWIFLLPFIFDLLTTLPLYKHPRHSFRGHALKNHYYLKSWKYYERLQFDFGMSHINYFWILIGILKCRLLIFVCRFIISFQMLLKFGLSHHSWSANFLNDVFGTCMLISL